VEDGKKVYLELYRQRWCYRDCGHSFCDGAELERPYLRIAKQAEQEVLWQPRDRSFSHVERDLGLTYTTSASREGIDKEGIAPIREQAQIFLDIDEHSFRRQGLVCMVSEVKKKKVLGILRDDRIATLRNFLAKIA